MPPLTSVLVPQSALAGPNDSLNILVKLNRDIIQTLRLSLVHLDVKPKLVIKNGEYFLKLDRNALIESKKFNEPSSIQLYRYVRDSEKTDLCAGVGRIDMRLNLLNNEKSRLRKIQAIERPRSALNSVGTHTVGQVALSRSLPTSPNLNPVSLETSSLAEIRKLIHLLCLGPVSRLEILRKCSVSDAIIDRYGRPYELNEQLTYITKSETPSGYVLKDEYYRNVDLFYFKTEERNLVLTNASKLMQKLGYTGTYLELVVSGDFDPVLNALHEKRKLKELAIKKLELGKRKEEKRKTSPPTIENRKKKRTISDSSQTSVNSMHTNAQEEDSPITSQEELEEEKPLSAQQIELYHKFRTKYEIYSLYHRKLSKQKNQTKSELHKLSILETEVRNLKRQIWKLEG